jgi:hypothetical protein
MDKMTFLFAGYELRKRFAPTLAQFKVPSSCVTMDTGLCGLHPTTADRTWEVIEEETNSTTLRYDLSTLDRVYGGLTLAEQSRYCIYGYSIETERAKLVEQETIGAKGIRGTSLKFAYAEKARAQINDRFVLLGYEVVDASIEWLSGQSNCGFSYRDLEAFGPLNALNLYVTEASAKAFRDHADHIVSEHAPFAVWEIWGSRSEFEGKFNRS